MEAGLRWRWGGRVRRVVTMLGLLGLLSAPPPALPRSFPHTPDLLLDVQERWGASMQGYVVQGCVPQALGGLSVQMPSCRAFTARTEEGTPRLVGFDEAAPRTLTLPVADGTVWIAGRDSPGTAAPAWTCLAGTHYCWSAQATAPAVPSGFLLLARLGVAAGSVTTVEPLGPASPLDLARLDATVYATQFGLHCDGVTDNSAALEAALAALPATGGILVLPAAPDPCRFSRTLAPTTRLHLRGGGMRAASGTASGATKLEYTGSGSAIRLAGISQHGTHLEGFDLLHSGTATVGIEIDAAANMTVVRDVSINTPSVPFAQAGIRVRTTGNVHSTLLDRVHLRESAPTGVLIDGTQSYTKILHSRIVDHTGASVQVGGDNPARDTQILYSDVSNALGGAAILIHRASFVLIQGAHIELIGAARGVSISDAAVEAENVRVVDSFINCLAGCLAPIYVNLLGADLLVDGNTLLNNSGGTAVAYVDNVTARSTIVTHNKLVDTLVPTVSSLVRTIVAHNMRTNAERGVVDGFQSQRLCADSSVVGTLGSGEDLLYSCTIPASQLYSDHMGVRVRVWGVTAINANTKRVRIYLAGTLVFDTQAQAASNNTWIVDCLGLRSGLQAMRIACNGGLFAAFPSLFGEFSGVIATPWDMAQTLTVTGEGSADGDVTTRGFYVEVLP